MKYENDETERKRNAHEQYSNDSLTDINEKLAQLEQLIPTKGTKGTEGTESAGASRGSRGSGTLEGPEGTGH